MFNFTLIGIGFIFLADCNIGITDILPDFIGVVLIFTGVGKAAYISENLKKAADCAKMWLVISAVKAVLNIISVVFNLYIFNDNDILLAVTFFGLAELLFSVVLFKNIFSGCDILLNVENSFIPSNNFNYLPKIFVSFTIVKFIFTLIPQLPFMLSEPAYDYLSVKYNTYMTVDIIKNFLQIPCVVAATLFGLFTLSLILPFFFSMSKSKNIGLHDLVKTKIQSLFLHDRFFILKKSLDSAFIFFAVGTAFFIDLEFDSVNILPDFVICLCFLPGIGILNRLHRTNIMQNGNAITATEKKLNLYLVLNLFISLAAYTFTVLYKSEAIYFYKILVFQFQIAANILYQISVIIFFLIFIEFFSYIKKIQQYHLDFSQRYLGKHMTSTEININKNNKKIIIYASCIFAIKSLAYILPEIGIVKFFHAVILLSFITATIKYLNNTKTAIYAYYT